MDIIGINERHLIEATQHMGYDTMNELIRIGKKEVQNCITSIELIVESLDLKELYGKCHKCKGVMINIGIVVKLRSDFNKEGVQRFIKQWHEKKDVLYQLIDDVINVYKP